MQFTEKETLQDAIIAHKYLMHMYCQFEIECSKKELRNLFEELYKVASEHDLKLFNIMNQKGYYPATAAPSKDVKQTIKMHTEMQEKLKQTLQEKGANSSSKKSK